jgi:hypothetical protein
MMLDTVKFGGGLVVEPRRILTTNRVVIAVWMPAHDGDAFGRGTTVRHIDGVYHWRVGSDPDRSLYSQFPAGSPERIAGVKAAYEARYAVAYAAIFAAYPELNGKAVEKRDGEVEFELEA